MSWQYWLPFFFSSLLISISPGSGAVTSMNSGIRFGMPKALITITGLQFGYMFYLIPVWIGLGGLLLSSKELFIVLKWTGVVYLSYFGVKQWLSKKSPLDTKNASLNNKPSRRQFVWQQLIHGFIVNFSNPKAAIFMIAVLPQFMEPERSIINQFVVMVPTLVIVDIVIMGAYAGLGNTVFKLLSQRNLSLLLNKIFGLLFLTMALLLAASEI